MYRVHEYGAMIADRVRMDAYTAALERAITPGAVVVDLGAGTGIMALLACRLGARRVHAIEPSPTVQLIDDLARENGFAGRIVVHRKLSTQVELPERADVIVSDMRGVLPPFQRNFADLLDARARLLAPSGRLIPERDRLFVAPVSAEEAFVERRAVWERGYAGLSLRSALHSALGRFQKLHARPQDLFSAPVQWAEIDYGALALRLRGQALCEVHRAGTAHGVLAWFDTLLLDEIGFSNHPAQPPALYGQAFFPWPEAVELSPGDRVRVQLRADPVGDIYHWTWTSEVTRAATPQQVEMRFRQSEFTALPLAAESLRRHAQDFQPERAADGEAALFALQRMQGGQTSGEIASALQEALPARFRDFSDALDFVAALADRYAQ